MTVEEIKQAAKNYLKANNIPFEAKKEGVECHLNIKKLNNLFYIEIHNRIFERMLPQCDPEYPFQEGEFPVVSRSAYRFVLDENGNVVIDLAEIDAMLMDSRNFAISLDEENIIVPIKKENASFNNLQHFRIQDGKGTLINKFEGCVSFCERLLKSKLLLTSGELYNFETGLVLRDEFGNIIIEEEGVQNLAYSWSIPTENRGEFIDTIVGKMEKENLFGGYKKIEVQKGDCKKVYHTFIYIDSNGNFVSSLYYVDDYTLTSVDNITPENIKVVFQQLEENLVSEIDALIAEKLAAEKEKEEKKRNFLQQLKMGLMKKE